MCCITVSFFKSFLDVVINHYRLLNAGLSPSHSTYAWLVDCYCNQNNAEAALRIPDEVARRGTVPVTSVYRAIIRRFCKKGMLGYAQRAFHQLQAKGLPSDSLLHAHLAYAHLHGGKPLTASEYLTDMARTGMMITVKIYNNLLASYRDSDQELSMFWNHAMERGVLGKKLCRLLQKSPV